MALKEEGISGLARGGAGEGRAEEEMPGRQQQSYLTV